MSNVMELSLRGASSLEKLMRAVLLDSENKVPSERLRIVGALNEGAIIEQGSNSNGDWVRLANGTQVCWKIFRSVEDSSIAPVDITISKGNMFVSPGRTWTFPATFNGYSCVLFSGFYAQGIDITSTFGKSFANGGSLATYYIISPISQTAANDVYYSLVAIGRWKA